MKSNSIIIALVVFCCAGSALSQSRDYVVQKRGMLHQTIFNTGELGRGYDQGQGGISRGIPSLEWPGGASTIIDGNAYIGQNNSFGGGMYMAANRPDTVARLYAFCGGAGSNTPEPVLNNYSFPLELTRTENYPVLANGDLNPNYNPDEAEEIIVSKWATPLGLTVTRTSRSWSFPDYDDFIIYEYEIENTGDRDGNAATPAFSDSLKDVLIAFAYGFTPSELGYERTYNRWNYADYENNDLRARFDRNRWLNYTVDRNGKPDPKYYSAWGVSQTNGGGLLSPQAVGFADSR